MPHQFETLFNEDGLAERTIDSVNRYQGDFLNVQVDRVSLPDGQVATREFIKHAGAVMIIPVFDDGDVLTVRQYRYPLKKVFIEFPAGKKDAGESPLEAGKRELLEETGYSATHWIHVTDIHNAIAYCDEVIHLYIARGLVHQGAQRLDAGEFVDVLRLPLSELDGMMRKGWIPDIKTQLGIFWLKDGVAGQ